MFSRVDFPEDPTCCVELSPDLCSLAPQALRAARELGELAGANRERAVL
jgi:hypothetical protein